ncbi:hypothetical protein CHS0354_037136 [Potamilus streckersoni]|uniref:Uncharacterized protein n=1 Tax=Potamilus streckersoni TaxID=2493646 RepID=A0AAE0RPB2_9BIVA|nr:hypothetical protein CHS0354_037136 [Potamilus streckersoni]
MLTDYGIQSMMHAVWHKNILVNQGKSTRTTMNRGYTNISYTNISIRKETYLLEQSKPGTCPKLQLTFEGLFVVVKKLNDLNYILQKNQYGTKKMVNHNKMKPYLGDNPPRWAKMISKQYHKIEAKFKK